MYNAILSFINPGEIVVHGYTDLENLYSDNSREAAIAREDLTNQYFDIIYDACDKYNSTVEEDKQFKYWEPDDDILDVIEKLYEYVVISFEVVTENNF